MKTQTRWRAGFTLIEIMIVVAVISLLAAMAIPHMFKARRTSHTNACINNLRQIDNAKEQWALEKGKTVETPDATEIQPYLGRGNAGVIANVHCPVLSVPAPLAGYDINAIGVLPSCQNYNDPDHPATLQ